MAQSSYDERVSAQIRQFADQPIHDLPPIFHFWSGNFIGPGMEAVFGAPTVNDVYRTALEQASQSFSRPSRVLSVGCGDGTVELELARSLLEAGIRNFVIDGFDLSPTLIDRFREQVATEGLGEFLRPQVRDLNDTQIDAGYAMIMANHSLHHIVELEKVFDSIFQNLADDGIFATCDMIGRNGHMRWPETSAVLQAIWPLLSEKQRFHHQLLRFDEERFHDHDSSGEGFEGVRAQDILLLILQRFHAHRFLAIGGFVDMLVDRGYGHGFDPDNAHDRAFISAMAQINDMMLDAGMIKPTVMLAHFSKSDLGSTFFRNRTAASCVRLSYETPEWTRHFPS